LKKRKFDGIKKACSTGKSFLTQFNFDFCSKRYEPYYTAELALETKMVKLRELAEIYNRQTPVSLMEIWLVNLSTFMGFEITDQQARETAQYIFEEVGMLNIAEITLLFKRIKKGKYGDFYGRFNGQLILKACREYRKERGNILTKMSTDKQLKLI